MEIYCVKLKELREHNNKTQEQIAQILNTTAQYYQKYEKGVRPLPIKHLISLCGFYRVTSDYILGLSR